MDKVKKFLFWLSFSLFIASGIILVVALNMHSDEVAMPMQQEAATHTPTIAASPTETIPPSTPLATLTPSQTLRPPPTFEPPTLTPAPSMTPTITPTPTFLVDVGVGDIRGLESPTPSTTPGCEVREEWQLTYEVQALDALERIAQHYGTTSWELAAANCLTDANAIYVGQVLRVPGDVQPGSAIECVGWEVLTPINGASHVDGTGQLTFNWRGPVAPRNLVRILNSDGDIVAEQTVDLRQNHTFNFMAEPLANGTYTWYVYPLDMNYIQVHCQEGGPWVFSVTD